MEQSTELTQEVADALKGLSENQVKAVVRFVSKVSRDTLTEVLPAQIRAALADTLTSVGYTEEIAGLVQLLAARSGDSREDTLKKALTLYGLALDARRQGNRLAILSPEDDIVQDIIGFDVAETQAVG